MSRNARMVAAGAALLAVLVVGIVIGAAMFGGGERDGQVQLEAPTTPAAPSPQQPRVDAGGGEVAQPTELVSVEGLEGDARALAEAINRAAQLTYHATYRGVFPGEEGKVTEVTLEVWRRPPLARRDTKIIGGDRELHTAEYRTGDTRLGCLLLPGRGDVESQWTCTPAPADAVDPGHPVVGSVDPRAGRVTASDSTVQGTPVRCYVVEASQRELQEACFDAEGVPAAIDGGDGRLERVELQRGVPDDVFVPPETASAGGDRT